MLSIIAISVITESQTLKIQKVLYFIQVYFLMNKKDPSPCFLERIEAWDFGPVVPEAYCEYNQYGSGDIPTVESYLLLDTDNVWDFKRITFSDGVIGDDDKTRIDKVVDKFSDYSATDLVLLTQKQSPWINAYIPNKNNEISVQAIREYFEMGGG